MRLTRRDSMAATGIAALSATIGIASLEAQAEQGTELLIASHTYPWRTFAKRAGAPYERHTDKLPSAIPGHLVAVQHRDFDMPE